MVISKMWKLVRRPEGKPRLEDFKLVEEQTKPLADGDVLVEAVALSVDPYMRYRTRVLPLNSVMFGTQVARVIESRNTSWPVGKHLIHGHGWCTHTVITAEELKEVSIQMQPLPEMGDLPKSLGIGLLGMPGNTAYFGLLELGQPKAGETVLVNGAAGAVGSAVVQIAKIKGCTVIAFAGSDEKVQWVKELGADHAFNYKTTNISEALSQAAPNGIDVYFDNVGGKFTAEAMNHMALFGRVPLCGAISVYNREKEEAPDALTGAFREYNILTKQIRVEGFIVTRWAARWMEGINQLKEWVQQGKLKYRETVTRGFNNMPQAFLGLFDGDNIGKAVVLP